MIEPNARVRRHERVAARVVDGEALLVVLDEKQLHRINGVGAHVWELCDGRTIDAIARALVDEYDVAAERALADVREFVGHLIELGALVPEDPP